jgi:hypothetical protein
MADLLASGLTTGRKGSETIVHTYRITAPGTAAVATPIVIDASALNPVYIEGQVQIQTADSGGTDPTVGLGVTSSGTDLVGLQTATSASFVPDGNAVGKAVATAITTIYIVEGGVPAGNGVYNVIIKAESINLNPTN